MSACSTQVKIQAGSDVTKKEGFQPAVPAPAQTVRQLGPGVA